jgi:hypothetical protein
MRHLTEEELVERYYDQGAQATQRHLGECSTCSAAFAAVERDLASVRAVNVPERDENYAERMWSRVEAALPPKPRKARRVGLWRTLAYAAGCAVLAAGGFYGGTVWEKSHRQPVNEARAGQHPAAQATPQPQVVVVVLGDHLDRSERLLVELKHADPDSPELVNPLKDEARSLLAANRIFRQDAEKEGDPALTEALNHLETLLTGLASETHGLSAASIARLQEQMKDDGVLFQVRVLRSEDPHRNASVRVIARGGAA